MTYSSALKEDLCRAGEQDHLHAAAECYGMLLFGRDFSQYKVALSTEHPGVASRCIALLRQVLSVELSSPRPAGALYHISLEPEQDRKTALERFGHLETRPPLRLNLSNLEDEGDSRAFIRGAFLACGSMIDPEKRYHLEFLIYAHKLADDFAALLREFGLRPLRTDKGAVHPLYFRDSGDIEDLLTLMGAPQRAMDLMNLKIYKELRNTANRRVNFETANISRTVDAAARQNEAIRILRERGIFEELPEELQEVALLRLMNPEMSVSEMAAACGISRSGVSHRLRKLMRIAGGEESVV